MMRLVVFMHEDDGDRGWLDSVPYKGFATVDGETWAAVSIPASREQEFWASRPADGFDVRWCGRGETLSDIYDMLEDEKLRDLWREFAMARRSRTIVVELP